MSCFILNKYNCLSYFQYCADRIQEKRYSSRGRLAIVSLLIVGLMLVLWGIVVFAGLSFLNQGIARPNWVIQTTLFTQKLGILTYLPVTHLAILLVSIGCITFFVMTLLLPRIQNIPVSQRILF